MKLTAETVTKDNVIEYLEGKDIGNIGLDEYKKEIVFDDLTNCCEFRKNYENLINKNRDKDEDKDEKKRKSFVNIIFSSSVLPFVIMAIIWLLLIFLHSLFNTNLTIFLIIIIGFLFLCYLVLLIFIEE